MKIGGVDVKDISKEELMDTVVGAKGMYLSGGEQQRIVQQGKHED